MSIQFIFIVLTNSAFKVFVKYQSALLTDYVSTLLSINDKWLKLETKARKAAKTSRTSRTSRTKRLK
jgi:hypothetical protein